MVVYGGFTWFLGTVSSRLNWERGILVGMIGDAQGGTPVLPRYQ